MLFTAGLNGKIIKAIVAKNAAGSFTRKDIDVLTENAKKNRRYSGLKLRLQGKCE